MSSLGVQPAAHLKSASGGLPVAAPSSQAILLDKLNRKATPDSEALASSDDELDPRRQENPPSTVLPQKPPTRRASWLNDTSQAVSRPRKGSFASSSMSPTNSHPSTPSADSGAGTWGSHSASSAALGRGGAGSTAFPWGTAIWSNERKDASSRFAEVLQSPTTATMSPASPGHSIYDSGRNQTSPAPREQVPNPQIPFAIPLHPTPKTYRSMSYSVGQMEQEAANSPLGGANVTSGGRSRAIAHSGLHHRPSRPSMLSEMANDGSMLGKVNEDDDDDSIESMHASQHQSAEAKTIEMLTRENAMLRQQQQYQNARLRPRGISSAASYGASNGYFQEPVLEESDYAVDEQDELNDQPDMLLKKAVGRRMSEFGAGPLRSPFTIENRKLENVKKSFWQSSLGFSGLGDVSQSRRHSFADITTRHGSITSISDSVAPQEQSPQDSQHNAEFASPYVENSAMPIHNSVSAYFTGGANLSGAQQAIAQSVYGNQFPSPYAALHATYNNRSASPHRGMYGMTQPRHNQTLHIVLFKCARADVFYIQEGTGLTVKPGDLVIVEADRGTDLGTVARDNVDWQMAKELKEHYAEEHYKWLMMYSQSAAAAQDGTGAGLLAASNGMQGSAVGGMGPPNPHHIQEPNAGELKPKLIKRLAQSHEIHALRDKEGNEAKAKRVCMQKVKEHGLNMEILDAEFQMDWKKLTFYYFADSYINFNSLVTDLFKIYKTRIWMSAINPASFASPTLGLQAPSGIGPGAVGVGRGSGNTDRRQTAATAAAAAAAAADASQAFNLAATTARAVRPAHNNMPFNEPAAMAGANYAPVNFPFGPYGAFGGVNARNGPASYAPGLGPPLDPFPSAYGQNNDYHLGRGRFPSPQGGHVPHDQDVPPLVSQPDWVGSFQGLSLNSR